MTYYSNSRKYMYLAIAIGSIVFLIAAVGVVAILLTGNHVVPPTSLVWLVIVILLCVGVAARMFQSYRIVVKADREYTQA